MIKDLRPAWILVVGIAGGVPDDAFTLGDIVVGSRVVDFTLNALKPGGVVELGLTGGPMDAEVQGAISNLEVLARRFEEWNSEEKIGFPRPEIFLEASNFIAQDQEWRDKIHSSPRRHFIDRAGRPPRLFDGTIGSSSSLIKDEQRLKLLLSAARQIKAVEMELAGAYRAAHDNHIPIMSIRGISDIVGYRRSEDWIVYACEAAASFTLAFLKAEPKAPVRTWKDDIKYDKPVDAFMSAFDAVYKIDMWQEGESREEVRFKQILKVLRPKMEEMIKKQDHHNIVSSSQSLDFGGYLNSSHPR